MENCEYRTPMINNPNMVLCFWYLNNTETVLGASASYMPDCCAENCPLKNIGVKQATMKKFLFKEKSV